MSIIYVKNDALDEAIGNGVALVDFYADWCGPCKMIAPVLEELASEYAGRANIVKVNVDENPQIAAMYSIMSIPTLMMFKEGQAIEKTMGFKPKASLQGWIEQHLA